MPCRLSPRRILRAFAVGSLISFFGFFGVLLSFTLIKLIYLAFSSEMLIIVILRFLASGLIILLWLVLWWKTTLYIRNTLIRKMSRDDEKGGYQR
ncbi:MAG: hypothetical protein QXM14_02140 [Fervidicoccaceae archaeon]